MTRDLRRYARQTNTRLILGGIALLFLVGDGLIYWIYGRNAALLGFFCLIAGLSPLLLVWLALELVSWLSKQLDKS
jgi:hypothetical protein